MSDLELLGEIESITLNTLIRALEYGIINATVYNQCVKQLRIALKNSHQHIKQGRFDHQEATDICLKWERLVNDAIKNRRLH